MIIIDDKLIGDEVVDAHFVCDLSKCKGGCCEDGDAGAPLEEYELKILDEKYEIFSPYMIQAGKDVIAQKGKYEFTEEFGYVTPTINDGLCAYAFHDKDGIIKCAIEQAYNDGKLDWKKPISCHLYPIRIQESIIDPSLEFLNYSPREEDHLCNPACQLGEELKVPVYKFLKEPLIRKYGQEFYDTLDATAKHLEEEK